MIPTLYGNSFSKHKQEFKNIRDRLVEISHKLGMSVTDFKNWLAEFKKEKKNLELQKKKWLKQLRLVI